MKLVYLMLLSVAGQNLFADTLKLKDGRELQGEFMGATAREIRFAEEGGTSRAYGITQVDNVSFGSGSASSSSILSPNTGASGSADLRGNRNRGTGTRNRTGRYQIPSGTIVTVRMIDAINSNASNVGDTYRASLDEPILIDGATVVEKGADATVRVERVQQSGKLSGNEEIAVVLTEIQDAGRKYEATSAPAQVAAKSRGKDSAKVVGGTAVVGAIIGAIAGGGKGAAIGAAAGAGTGVAVQAIRGQRVEIPSETRLDFSLTQPVYVN